MNFKKAASVVALPTAHQTAGATCTPGAPMSCRTIKDLNELKKKMKARYTAVRAYEKRKLT